MQAHPCSFVSQGSTEARADWRCACTGLLPGVCAEGRGGGGKAHVGPLSTSAWPDPLLAQQTHGGHGRRN
jgi:hypothetical protein